MQKLDNYLYGLADKPPFTTLLILGAQHLVKFSLLLICPVLIVSMANGSPLVASNVISMSLIAGAVATLLMAMRNKIGAGCFIPAQASVPFFAALLITAKIGGMPLVFGMTIVAGLLQCFISPLLGFFKKYLDQQIAGFIVLIFGMWAALLGVSELFRPGNLGQLLIHGSLTQLGPVLIKSSLIGFTALAIMIGLRLLKHMRLYCILIGMLVGWLLALAMGQLLPERVMLVKQASWFALPHFLPLSHFTFNWHLLLPFLAVAILASLEVFALIAVIQNLETKQWQTDIQKISRGNLAAGIGVIFSGLLGGIAQSPIPGSIGDLIATGAHSRYIAFIYAPVLFVLAFCPKFAMIFLTIPAAVNGAAIVFMGAVMLMKGVELLQIDTLRDYQAHAFGLAFLLALSADIFPQIFLQSQSIFSWTTNYDLMIGLIVFIVLRLLFRLGQRA